MNQSARTLTIFASKQLDEKPAVRERPGILQRVAKRRLSLLGMMLVALIVVAALAAPWISPYDYREQSLLDNLRAPSREHLLGTDVYGRDIFSRIIWGGRVSLTVACFAVAVAMLIGVTVGLITGYAGGSIDAVGMRIVDMVIAVPSLYFMMVLVGVFGPSTLMTIIAIGLTSWTGTARILRAEILSIKEREFILAARATGLHPVRLALRHILLNAISPLIVQATLFCAQAILLEASLSFLGLGVQPPVPSWGSILNEGRRELLIAPWITTSAGLAIFVTVLGFNLVGDGLRDALDPKQTRSR